MTYYDELIAAMTELGKDDRVLFIGQAVRYPGTAIYRTLVGVPDDKKIELPVAEDMQMGMAIGLSLRGYVPVCIYPRINFLLLAVNQLVLHLDKLPEFGNGWRPKVIVRTSVASPEPMDPGPQHLGDFSFALADMLRNVTVRQIWDSKHVGREYQHALNRKGSSLLIERASCYGNE